MRARVLIAVSLAACGSPRSGTTAESGSAAAIADAGEDADTDEIDTDSVDPTLQAVASAMTARSPVRIVTVTTQTWGCCGVAPFIVAAFPVGGPDDAYLLTVPRDGVADPEAARRPGLHVVLWGTLRPARARVRDWLGERRRPLPTTPDAVANLDKAHPVLEVDAWCVREAIGPTRCAETFAVGDAVVPQAAPARATIGGAVHPVVAGEPGGWRTAATPTGDGERVTLTGPKERGVTLGLALESWSFDDDRDAIRKLVELEAGADPDTGLSYGWDTVERRGAQLLHLHGGCRWSRGRWTQIVERMHAWLGPADERLACGCGGGCTR